MKKIVPFILLLLIFTTGCETKEEKAKSEYIAVKSNLLSATNYKEELPLDIIITLDRTEEEQITYQVELKKPKENMHQIKALVVHNYNNEDKYPSIGLFDDTKDLLTSTENATLNLEGTIQSAKNMSELDLQLKIWIEYTNDQNETKEVYYQT